jgi:hypothetical protein
VLCGPLQGWALREEDTGLHLVSEVGLAKLMAAKLVVCGATLHSKARRLAGMCFAHPCCSSACSTPAPCSTAAVTRLLALRTGMCWGKQS